MLPLLAVELDAFVGRFEPDVELDAFVGCFEPYVELVAF